MNKKINPKDLLAKIQTNLPGIKGILLGRIWLMLVFVFLAFVVYSGLIYYQYIMYPTKAKTLLAARDSTIKTNLFDVIKQELSRRESNLKQIDQSVFVDPFR